MTNQQTDDKEPILGSECPWCGKLGFHADVKWVGIFPRYTDTYLAAWCYVCGRCEHSYPDARPTRVVREGHERR